MPHGQTRHQRPAESPFGRYLPLLREHLGLAVGAGVVVLVAVRIAAVSNWHTTTAAALLQYTGGTNVLLGATIAAAPMLLVYLMSFYVAHALWRHIVERQRPHAGTVVLIVAAVIWMILISQLVVLGLAAFIIACGVGAGFADRGRDRAAAQRENGRFVGVMVGTLFLTFYGTGSAPWLPPESITVEDEEFTGYVMGTDDSDRLVVLRRQPREVVFLDGGGGVDRSICARNSVWSGTLLQLIGGDSRPTYPECPTG